jgi:hypothetical protein
MEYLLFAVLMSVIGATLVAWRHRRPRGIDAGIAEFEARRQALAPQPAAPRRKGRGAG